MPSAGSSQSAEIAHLDALCAPRIPGRKASERKPFRLGQTHPFAVVCKPMDADWKARLAADPSRHWYSGNPEFGKPYEMLDGRVCPDRYWDLARGLVALGGEQACLPVWEWDLDKIVDRGQLWSGERLRMHKGAPVRCHENCCDLWAANQGKLFIATGYGLSDDGLWRRHSWCLHESQRGVQVVETTVARQLYFGFVMTLQETLDFCEAQEFGERPRVKPGTAQRYRAPDSGPKVCPQQAVQDRQAERMRV